MPRSLRVCCVPGCPELIAACAGGRCPTHRAEVEWARGTRQQRGYTAEHVRLRKQLGVLVAQGRAICARCHDPIDPTEPWDLGHSDDRKAWTGPEHTHCNRAAGGKAAHG